MKYGVPTFTNKLDRNLEDLPLENKGVSLVKDLASDQWSWRTTHIVNMLRHCVFSLQNKPLPSDPWHRDLQHARIFYRRTYPSYLREVCQPVHQWVYWNLYLYIGQPWQVLSGSWLCWLKTDKNTARTIHTVVDPNSFWRKHRSSRKKILTFPNLPRTPWLTVAGGMLCGLVVSTRLSFADLLQSNLYFRELTKSRTT